MNEDQLRSLLEQVRCGEVAPDEAIASLRHMPFEDLGFAKVDHHRALRHGMPEVVFAKGKTPEQVVAIAAALLENAPQRADHPRRCRRAPRCVTRKLPGGEYFPLSGAIRFWRDRTIHGKGKIAVVCAGTSDMPVAEEAQVTAEVMGNEVDAIHDIGVAGIHRLMQQSRAPDRGARHRGLRRHGRRAAQRGRRPGLLPRHRRPHQHRLWRQLPWPGRAARHAEQLRQQCDRGQYR